MNDSDAPVSMTSVARIGIHGLPSLTDSMIDGGLYVLIAETPSARFPILAGSLMHALKEGLVCTVIVPANPGLFIQRVESFGGLNASQLVEANRLHFFVMQDEFSKNIFRFGAERFVRELEQFEIPENSYLLFDQADELLSLHDISLATDQIDILRSWSAKQRVTLLMVFSRVTEAHSGTLNALMDSLTGIARLGADKDGLELTFDYWQSPEGTIAARNYRLVTLDTGLYEASIKIAPQEQAVGEEKYARHEDLDDTEPRFFYMDPDLGSLARQVPGVWQQVDTLVGMMHATRNTRAATSILSFQRDTNLRQLAEAVHTLRLSLGRRARIVVQEKGASLRYQNEALLLRLGLNLVVHRDVATSRLPLLLDSLSGQTYNRDVDINFEAALASVLPTRLRGYLLPLRFVREVEVILDQAETLNIPCAMIIGKPGPGTTVTDILANNGLSRPGDLISADGEFCYLFLNACPQSVMLLTLERILGMPVDAAMDNIRFLIRREEIQAELAALSRAAEQGDLPDYSSLIGVPQDTSGTELDVAGQQLPTPKTLSNIFTEPTALGPNQVTSIPEPVGLTGPRPTALPAFLAPKPKTNSFAAASRLAFTTPMDAATIAPGTPSDQSLSNYRSAQPASSFGRKPAPRASRSAPSIDSTNLGAE